MGAGDHWITDRSEIRRLSDAIILDDGFWHPDEIKRLKCPVCGDDYQHIGSRQDVPGRDSYEAGWGGRGDLLVIPVEGECGHTWQLCFGSHKGNVAAFVRVPLDEDGSPKILEDGIPNLPVFTEEGGPSDPPTLMRWCA